MSEDVALYFERRPDIMSLLRSFQHLDDTELIQTAEGALMNEIPSGRITVKDEKVDPSSFGDEEVCHEATS